MYDAYGTGVDATYTPSELHIPSTYYNYEDDDYDYGLIYVNADLSQYGKMPLGIVTNNFKLTGQDVYVSGFPKYVRGIYKTSRYYGVGTIENSGTTDYQLCYTTYANGGDSGGPAYIEYTLNGDTYRSAIGIHAWSLQNETLHYATRITLPVLRFFYSNPYV